MQRSPIVFLLPVLLFFVAVCSTAQSPKSATQQSSTESAPAAASSAQTGPASATSSALPSAKEQAKTPEPEAPEPPSAPQQPKTEILDSSATSAALATDGHDPILDPPPFPQGITTLVGGIISDVDRIRNHLTISIFGGGQWTMYFDERTHIFNNGAEATPLALKKGERVYVDTMLDNNNRDIFARNIRVGVVTPPAGAAGQIIEVSVGRQEIALRDSINSTSVVRFVVDGNTRISRGSQPATLKDLAAGSLVRVQFAADRFNRAVAREILILAVPGSVFTFAGTITYLDTHRNVFSVRNLTDDKTYDIFFIPSKADAGRLAVGAEVKVVALFETTHYAAQQITVIRMAGAAAK